MQDHTAPRALPHQSLIWIGVTPTELHKFVRVLEADAMAAIEEDKHDFADFLLRRVAELREAGR
jgi:hypothetical protein